MEVRMKPIVEIQEKYERNGWPSLPRPDLKTPDGWDLHLLTAVSRIRNHSLSPDGKTIAFIWDRDDLSDIYQLQLSKTWPERLSTHRQAVAYWDDEIPRWSPDGQWLAFCMHDHVHIAPANGGLPRKISDFTSAADSPIWMPDSQHLILSIERHEATQLMLSDRDGAWPKALTDDKSGDAWEPRPAPDGQSIAYVYRPFDDLNRLDIRLIQLESGRTLTLVGNEKEKNHTPRWSPDGKRLAFLSQRTGFFEIWLLDPQNGQADQLTHLGCDLSEIQWSPDGKRIACVVNQGGSFELAVISLETGEPTTLRIPAGVHANPQWLPDNLHLTFEFESPLLPPDIYLLHTETGELSQLTFSNPPALANLNFVMPEVIEYASADGLKVPGFLFQPAQANQAGLVNPHGGPSDQYGFHWDIFTQYLLAKGYTLLAPNYRGSTGYGRMYERLNYDDWGVGDTQDCLAAGKYLAKLPGIDAHKLAIFGGSYGGYMTNCCLARDPEYIFACGIAKFGDANLTSSWAQCNRQLRLYSEIFLGHPAQKRAVYLAGSPLLQAERVKHPILILHGLEDDVVPPQASEEWVEALRKYGKTFEYKTYAKEPHGFLRRANQLDVYTRMERFLDWYLLPKGVKS
jgi:dipeptidyl aminopeptidase/acylaminoacyl peptidase